MLKLRLIRYWSDADHSLGVLWVTDPQRFVVCFSLEDEHRTRKVYGKTRIPAGTYPLTLNTNTSFHWQSPTNHEKYLRRFGPEWHVGMLELVDVPNFTHSQIHIGNDDDDTEGCILTGESAKRGWVSRSEAAYRRVYPILAEALVRGEPCFIEITDLDLTEKEQTDGQGQNESH